MISFHVPDDISLGWPGTLTFGTSQRSLLIKHDASSRTDQDNYLTASFIANLETQRWSIAAFRRYSTYFLFPVAVESLKWVSTSYLMHYGHMECYYTLSCLRSLLLYLTSFSPSSERTCYAQHHRGETYEIKSPLQKVLYTPRQNSHVLNEYPVVETLDSLWHFNSIVRLQLYTMMNMTAFSAGV